MKKHHKAWVEQHGSIKPGNHIHHIDGNHSNNDVSNLISISRQMHAAFHKDQFDMFGNEKDGYAYNRLTLEPKLSGFKRRGGWKLSKETRDKMSVAKKGCEPPPITEETRKKMSDSRKGYKASAESKEKMSAAKSGKNHPLYSKHHSPETKQKMRVSRNNYLKKTIMNLDDKKLWGSISLDKIKEAKAKAGKRFKTSEQYGQQMTFDAKQWDDGGISLSVSYQDESEQWQRITIGTIRISKEQADAGNTPYKAENAAPPAQATGDLPF